MRNLFSTAPALLLAALPFAGAAQEAGPEPATSEITIAIEGVEKLVSDVDAMIADQETRLAARHERRDVSDPGSARQSIDALIDRLTLQLDEMETLRGTLDGQATALRAALDSTGADPAGAGAFAE